MLASLRAFARTVLGETQEPAWESLEDRVVLAAPTATILSTATTADSMLITVRWQSNFAINVSTIGNGDIGMNSDLGYAQTGVLVGSPIVDNAGSVRATYRLGAAEGRWDFTHTTTYRVGVAANAVRNNFGEGSAAAGIGSFWLWFDAPRIDLPVQNLTPSGWNVVALLRARTGTFLGGELSWARLVTPSGQIASQINLVSEDREVPAEVTTGLGVLTAPGGAWDYTDTGTYTLVFGFTAPGPGGTRVPVEPPALSRQIPVEFDMPRSEVTTTEVRTRDWLISVRYTHPDGINMATIGSGDITVQLRGNTTNPDSGLAPVNGVLHQAPVRNTDGSVTAIYRVNSPDNRGWSYFDNGTARVRMVDGAVSDSNGGATNPGIIRTFNLWFPRPSFSSINVVSATPTEWLVDVNFDNRGGLINVSSLNAQDLQVQSSTFVQTRVQMQQYNNSANNLLTVRYRLTPNNAVRFFNGTYTISLVANQVQYEVNQTIGGRLLGSWYLWFPPA